MSSYLHSFGVRKALRDFGFTKEAEEMVDPETGEPIAEDPEAEMAMDETMVEEALAEEAEATGNPFIAMSDEEVVAYLQSLPPEVLEAVLAQLSGDQMMEAPAGEDLE